MQVLSLDNISKKIKNREILKNVSLSVDEGEILGLLGPNGAGKTTLMKIISGLSLPSSGKVLISGTDAVTCRSKVKDLIGFVMQDNNMEREFTIREALLSYARLYRVKNVKKTVDEAIRQFDMQNWQEYRIDRLSGGMARKTMIARALLAKPKLLLLDEPSVGLDPDVRLDIWQEISRLRRQRISIIITTHYMEEAEILCDRIAILKQGKLLAVDTVDGLKHIMTKNGEACTTLEKAFLRFIGREVQ